MASVYDVTFEEPFMPVLQTSPIDPLNGKRRGHDGPRFSRDDGNVRGEEQSTSPRSTGAAQRLHVHAATPGQIEKPARSQLETRESERRRRACVSPPGRLCHLGASGVALQVCEHLRMGKTFSRGYILRNECVFRGQR